MVVNLESADEVKCDYTNLIFERRRGKRVLLPRATHRDRIRLSPSSTLVIELCSLQRKEQS